MDTLTLGVTYIRRCVLEHPHFLHFREVVSVYDDDVFHLRRCIFLFIWSKRFSVRGKERLYYIFLMSNGQSFEFTVVQRSSLYYLCALPQEKINYQVSCFLI